MEIRSLRILKWKTLTNYKFEKIHLKDDNSEKKTTENDESET